VPVRPRPAAAGLGGRTRADSLHATTVNVRIKRLKEAPPDGTAERPRELAETFRAIAAVYTWQAEEMEARRPDVP
jgi:hypothetical protein